MLNFVRPESFKVWRAVVLLALSSAAFAVHSADADDVSTILAGANAPAGVVFEVVSGNEAALESALPRTQKFIRQLRERFPGLAVAVVSHGSEQFALTTDSATRFGSIHEFARTLRSDDAITVEVCGNHAAMRGVSGDSFPDYVKVVPRAPGAIDAYVAQGYQLVIID